MSPITMDTAAASAAIEAESLTKTFGQFVATDRVSFRVPQEEICGLLGPKWRREVHYVPHAVRAAGADGVGPISSGRTLLRDATPSADRQSRRLQAGRIMNFSDP